MDWLSTHRVSKECFTKKVGYPFTVRQCVISNLEAKRLLHKGCEAYLAHVIDTSTPKVTLENMQVV